MYTYQHTIGSIYVILKDNNPEPIAKTWNESQAQTIINALNLQEHMAKEYPRTLKKMEANIKLLTEWKTISQAQQIAGTEEIEEAGPPHQEQSQCISCGSVILTKDAWLTPNGKPLCTICISNF